MPVQAIIHSVAVILLLLVGTPAFAAATPGQPAPDFTLSDTNGAVVTLSALHGTPVVLEWTNHDCPFVKKHYVGSQNMQSLQQFAADHGIVWISVISSARGKQGHVSDEAANAIAEERGAVPAHILRDPSGELGRLYGAKTTPHLFVVGTEGNVVYAGAIDSRSTADPADIAQADNYVQAAMQAVLDGTTPDVTISQPYGCSIKYGS